MATRAWRWRRVPTPALILGPGLALALAAPAPGQPRAPAHDTIRESDLRSDVAFLAADAMTGRLTDTEGNRVAAEYLRARFARLGLRPVAGDGYLMPFDLVVPEIGDGAANTLSRPGAADGGATLGRDFYPERFSGTGTARGSVVFVGFGIVAPDLGHDDYAGRDVTGRIVLVLDHEPGEWDAESRFDGADDTEHGRNVRKAIEAARRGAAAVLFVDDVHNHEPTPALDTAMARVWPARDGRGSGFELGAWLDQLTIPAARISTALADRLAARIQTSLAELAVKADSGAFVPVDLESELSLQTEVERRRITTHNVVGLIPGADPTVRDEWVILGAHFDHEGVRGRRVYAGADDNASGVAGMLEVAEAFATAVETGARPRRSVLFAGWNAEERGLLGAWAYTEGPLTPLDRTVAVLNLDMIGRDEEVPARAGRRFRGLPPQTAVSNQNAVNILGYSFSDDLRRAAEAANEVDLTVRFRYDDSLSDLLRRSDHWPFLARGVPALFVHTGLHPDYHTDRDRAERLNYEKMTRIVRLVHELCWHLANADTRPALNPRGAMRP